MLKFLKSFFSKKPSSEPVVEAPYKVETPAQSTPVAEQATQAMVESVKPEKKARKPRAPKAEKPAVKKPRKTKSS